jgi:dTDP-4-dehydrorhamnose reductase
MFEENKLLITGGTGKLGRACKKIFGDAIYPTRKDMDITSPEMIKSFLNKTKPKYIIHLAAMVSIPGCEENKELTRNVNTLATKNLVEIAKKI